MTNYQAYALLFAAIAFEVVGSTALKYSDGMRNLLPALVVLLSYAITFWLFSIALRVLPLGTASALWSGLGIAGSAIAGAACFGERLGATEFGGFVLILGGCVLLTLFSTSGQHA